MRPIILTSRSLLLGAAAAALVAAAHADINDSIRGAASEANHFIATPKGWKNPKTPWGEPDIQSTLNMMQTAFMPLERCGTSYRPTSPPCDMNKAWLTEEEYNQRVEAANKTGDRSRELFKQGNIGGALQAGATDSGIPQRQTNLIFDPPNGLLPALTPEGKRRGLLMRSDWALPGQDLTFDGPQDFDSWDRCITRGMPSSMMHYYYNGGFKILQSPGVVVFSLEMIHEARVIYTDGRAPIPSAIKQWMGESRGHWEGDTLVVETTNYREGPPLMNLAVAGSPPGNHFPMSEQMKTTERLTRLNDDSYLYEIKTEDPIVLTRSFTVRYPMRNDPSYLMPEYACHEDNQIVPNYTKTNRYERAHPTPEPAQPPVTVGAGVADALAGTWVGRPRIVTIDVDIQLQFTKNRDGTVNGKLIGTNLGKIDKPFRNFKVADKTVSFTMPNIDPWSFQGELKPDGDLTGVVFSAQGGLPVTFKRTAR